MHTRQNAAGRIRRFSVIASAGALLCSCYPGEGSDLATNRKLEGYGGLVLGSSFEEAMSAAPPSSFNAYGLKECIEDMPMRGCFLSPDDDLTVFRRVQGIPYALQLEFNRLGALTDITLRFSRRRTYDDNLDPVPATITEKECSDILARTVDWVSQDYGILVAKRPKGSGDNATKTAKGNPYWIERTSDGKGYVASGTVKMAGGRSVGLFSHFLVLDREPPYR